MSQKAHLNGYPVKFSVDTADKTMSKDPAVKKWVNKVEKAIAKELRKPMTRFGDWLNHREIRKAEKDLLLHGKHVLHESRRQKSNPMYWLAGPIKLKRIDPKKMFSARKLG